ncbi:MAG: hypothetical protein ACUVQX_00220 [Candidatus Bathycorpusculaceae bacterium]
MAEADGYILRIATKDWVERVFDMAIYYTGFRRKWKAGQIILFVHKTALGDAFVGYGEIGNVLKADELSEEERLECEKWGWLKAIEFKYIIRFAKPLPIKETFLKDLKIRGRALHGFPLNKEQLNAIVSFAEKL